MGQGRAGPSSSQPSGVVPASPSKRADMRGWLPCVVVLLLATIARGHNATGTEAADFGWTQEHVDDITSFVGSALIQLGQENTLGSVDADAVLSQASTIDSSLATCPKVSWS